MLGKVALACQSSGGLVGWANIVLGKVALEVVQLWTNVVLGRLALACHTSGILAGRAKSADWPEDSPASGAVVSRI